MPYRDSFISSPVSDAFFLLGCPLFVLSGLVLLLHYNAVTLTAFVIFTAIYTGAHHLPGFFRAYGTREIFNANRVRLIVAPVLLLSLLAYMEFRGLRGYIVVLWFFNWWHTAMQNYGLMRVYERKVLPAMKGSVMLDMATLLVWHFTASEVFSDDMRFDLSQHLFNLGVSNAMFVSSALWILRWTGIVASVILAALYIRNLIVQFRSNATIAINKQIFLITTYGLYFFMFSHYTKDISTSVESFFHNTQYLFFVWVMQRRLAQKGDVGRAFNWFGSLFSIRSAGVAVLVYGGAIAAWGYLMGGSIKPRIAPETVLPVFNALYATSAFLHYYTDSFIWKARTRQISATLGLKGGGGVEMSRSAFGFSLAEMSAMILVPIVLATALTNPKNRSHQSLRENASLAAFSSQLLTDRARWPGAAVAAVDVGDSMELSDPARSVEWYRRAVAARPDYADAYQALGHAYSRQNQFIEAAEAYEKAVALDPTFVASFNNLGNAYAASGQPALARLAYQHALALDPDFAPAYLNLGYAEAGLGDRSAARTAFEKARDLDPEAFDAPAYMTLGKIQFESGDFADAEESLNRTITLAPAQAAGYIGMSQVYVAEQKFDEALALLEQGIKVEPSSGEAHAALGALYEKRGRTDEALKEFEESVRLDPALPSAYFAMADIWEKKGDRALTLKYLNDAAAYDPLAARKRIAELQRIH
jgi:tetratricopeptide (TPR) repeat protein